MNIVAKANDTNDILQTFRYLLLSSSVHGNRTAVILLQVIGHSGEKRCKKMKSAKGCFSSDVVVRSIHTHMTQLDTHQWWWHVMSRVKH